MAKEKYDLKDGVWRTIGGRRVFIRTGQSLSDAMKESGKFNLKKKDEAQKLSELEYETLSEEFAESLSEEEKELIERYGIGGTTSVTLNTPQWRELERTYRIEDENYGYIDKKISYIEALETPMNKKLYNIKTNDENYDENIKFNYEMIQRDKEFLKGMDNIFENKGITLDKDILVFRKGYETIEDLQNGVVRYGYTSTSAKSRINKSTPGGLKLGENEFEIIVPKGTKILPIKQLVPDDVKSQNEILLPRNLKFELVEDKTIPGGWNKEKWDFEKRKNKYLVKVK